MSLETLGLENISQVWPDRAEDPQNQNARKALPPTFSVLKRSRAIFRPASSKVRVQKVFLGPFHWKPRPSGVTLEPRDWKISPYLREIQPKYPKIPMRVRWSRLLFQSEAWGKATFRVRNLTPSERSFYLCPFHWKLRQSGVLLQLLKLENTPQVLGNRAIEAQNHDACKAASATLSILKWSGAKLFGPEAGKSAFTKFCCFHFTPNQDRQEFVYSSRDWKISPKFREINPKFVKITMRVTRSRLPF